MTKTIEQWAEQLNGINYDNVEEYRDDLEKDGMVIVYGASDDLMEMSGAINEEYDAMVVSDYIWIEDGFYCSLLLDEILQPLQDDCTPLYDIIDKTLKEKYNQYILANPDVYGCQFEFTTNIPHKKFKIMEDGELYCEALIFDIKSLQSEN